MRYYAIIGILCFLISANSNLLAQSDGGSIARLQVIHNSADVLAGSVDVYLNGSLLLNDFAFRTATPFIDAPANVVLNIGIAPGNSTSVNDTLKNFPVVLDSSETYVVFANGVLTGGYASNPDGRDISFNLFVKPMARETSTGSDVEFFAFHGATDAPTVDVIAREVSATLVNDAAYGDITNYLAVPPGAYTLDLTLSNGTTVVQSYIADLNGLGGSSLVVFASGFLDPSSNQNGASFGIFAALANGTVVQLPEGVVPVELSAFSANVNGNNVSLKWSTSSELNNRGFEIQRKQNNNQQFEALTFINGNGTTSEINNYNYEDNNLSAGKYIYRLKQVDYDGTFEFSDEIEVDVITPAEFSLEQNYPNPFNPSTKISFTIPVESYLTIKVFNILGEEVNNLFNGTLTAGLHSLNFDAVNLNSGIYFYKIEARGVDGSDFSEVKKMTLTK